MSDQTITPEQKAAARAASAAPDVSQAQTTQEMVADLPTLEKYVRDALNKAGHKVGELTPEQHARATSAPTEKPGVRGKTLATYIIDGTTLRDQAKQANDQETLRKAEATHAKRSEAAKADGRAANLNGGDKPKATNKAKGGDAKPKAAAKPKAPPKTPAKAPKYADNIRAAVEATKAIGGRTWWPSPIDHVQVRNVVTKLLAEQTPPAVPSRANIKALVGTNEKTLRRIADMSAPREELKVLKDLNTHMDDSSSKGRNLAAILLVWMDELDANAAAATPDTLSA
jgi:hypothetical protein